MTWTRAARLLALLCLLSALGCDPEVLVGREIVLDGSAAGSPNALGTGGMAGAPSSSDDAGAAAAGTAGTSNVDALPPVPWTADFETDATSEWTAGGFGWVFTTTHGSLEASSEQAQSGNRSLKSILSPTAYQDQAVVGRRVTLVEGYYSAWFFLPSEPGALARVIMKLSAWGPDADVFDITLGVRTDGQLGLELFSHYERAWVTEPDAAPPIPRDRWFEVKAFYRSSPEADGRVLVWQDGAPIIDTGPRVTGPTDQVTFIVGSVAAATLDVTAALYVDNARIEPGEPPE